MFNVVELKKMLEECVGNDFGGDIIPHAFTSGRKVSVFEFDDYWIDAGTISDLYQANMDLLGPAPRINLYDHSKPIMHRPRHLPSPKFVNGSQVQDSIVGDGSIITGSVMSSVLSSCVWVDENALVDRCVIFDDVKIGIGAKITKAIIDKHCRIEAGVVLGQNLDLDKTLYPEISIRDGIIVVPKNTTLKKVD